MTIKEQLEALKVQIATIESNLSECEDQGPEFDSAGFTEADRLEDEDGGGLRHCGDDYYSEADPNGEYIFTKAQLLDFAGQLMDRTKAAIKKAINEGISNIPDDVVSLEINSFSRVIEVEIDYGSINDEVMSCVDSTVELDSDTIEDEMNSVLKYMDGPKIPNII